MEEYVGKDTELIRWMLRQMHLPDSVPYTKPRIFRRIFDGAKQYLEDNDVRYGYCVMEHHTKANWNESHTRTLAERTAKYLGMLNGKRWFIMHFKKGGEL